MAGPEKPERIRFQVSLTPEEYEALKRAAHRRGIPRLQVLLDAINRALADD